MPKNFGPEGPRRHPNFRAYLRHPPQQKKGSGAEFAPKFGLFDSENSDYGLKRKRDREEVELEKNSERQETEVRKRRKTKKTLDAVQPSPQVQSDQRAEATHAAPIGRPQGPISRFFKANQSKDKLGFSSVGKSNILFSQTDTHNTHRSQSEGQIIQLEGSEDD